MKTQTTRYPLTSYFFIFFLVAGAALLVASLIYTAESGFFSWLRQIAFGILLVGIGEWINHPLQKTVALKDKEKFVFQKILHRKRTPSELGNLIEISGLLLFFSGLAEYF